MKEINFERADAFAWGEGDVIFNTPEETAKILAEIAAREAGKVKERREIFEAFATQAKATDSLLVHRLGLTNHLRLGEPVTFVANTGFKDIDEDIRTKQPLTTFGAAYIVHEDYTAPF